MFDTTATIEVAARSSAGLSTIMLRWPTDEEWTARTKGRKISLKNLGRGRRETSIESGDADLKLYDLIKQNGAPPLTPAEATKVVEALALCETTDVEVEGDEAIVTLQIITGAVKHCLKLPTADAVLKFRKAAYRMVEQPYNRQEIRLTPEAGGKLWDVCQGRGEGYAGAVPVIHKDTAVRAVIEYLDNEVAPKSDESDF